MYSPHRMSLDDVRNVAPSVFATTPWSDVSDKYRFIPTADILAPMLEQGFEIVRADQAKCRIEGKKEFTRHVVRLRHPDLRTPGVGDSIPEIALMNSHDRTSGFKLMMGFFRVVCANGLMVCTDMMGGIATQHTGKGDLVQEIIEGSYRIINDAPKVAQQVGEWQQLMLPKAEQVAFANAALELRVSDIDIPASELLDGRRAADRASEDGSRSLWCTMNTVQENLIRGGCYGRNAKGQLRRTRGIKSVAEDTKLNRALWRLTEELAKAV